MAYPVTKVSEGELPIMVVLLDAVQRLRPEIIVATSLAMVGFVAVGDIITGAEISFAAFYLLPVVLATSGTGAKTGIRTAVITALAWLAAEMIGRGSSAVDEVLVHVWNASVRFVVFALVVALLDALNTSVDHERTLSREDSLSGLPNSRAFYELAEHERKAMARAVAPLTIAYIDIDNFKAVNDTLGHSVGDVVLRSTARTLAATLRDADVAGRLGGDEFALLLPRTDAEAAATVLARIHEALSLEASGQRWPIGYSIGSVTFTAAPSSVDAMVSRSDELMYEVKTRRQERRRRDLGCRLSRGSIETRRRCRTEGE